MYVTKSQLISIVESRKPHVVVLGAGASRAAFPEGDGSGKQIPLMPDLIQIIGLNQEFENLGIDPKQNFEAAYDLLSNKSSVEKERKSIENAVYEYFSSLRLLEAPTIYDLLLLSLRPRDLVATFNWDPFLYDAWHRCKDIAPMPRLAFLHGNVRVRYCNIHGAIKTQTKRCPTCGGTLNKSKLLYPISKKNYQDPTIKPAWDITTLALQDSTVLTIFGYGAPESDVEAVSLLKNAWKANPLVEVAETEIIDIKEQEVIYETWSRFVEHYRYKHRVSFGDSWIRNYPRRTCEAHIRIISQGIPVEFNPIPLKSNFEELKKWLEPLLLSENSMHGESGI